VSPESRKVVVETYLEVVGDITSLGLVKYSAATVAGVAEKRLLSFVS
jgi:hypothetical protein